MIFSMTAFAQIETKTYQGSLTWELKSVNHRFLDQNIKIPDDFREIEFKIREEIRKNISRGKVDCFLKFTPNKHSNHLQIDRNKAQQYISLAEDIVKLSPKSGLIDPVSILNIPEVIISEKENLDLLKKTALQSFKEAINKLKDYRLQEGHALKKIINTRLISIDQEINKLNILLPEMLDNQRQKIKEKITEMNINLDPSRLEQEIALLAQKSDVNEELDRLKTHIQEVSRTLNSKEPKGRRLDFLMQELNREANTLGSKAFDIKTTQTSVNLKVCIEQIREQIQNVE